MPANMDLEPREELGTERQLPYTTWRSLNRLRRGVARCRSNLLKWGYSNDEEQCDCGQTQSPENLLICPKMGEVCTEQDLMLANNKVIIPAEFWKNNI